MHNRLGLDLMCKHHCVFDSKCGRGISVTFFLHGGVKLLELSDFIPQAFAFTTAAGLVTTSCLSGGKNNNGTHSVMMITCREA